MISHGEPAILIGCGRGVQGGIKKACRMRTGFYLVLVGLLSMVMATSATAQNPTWQPPGHDWVGVRQKHGVTVFRRPVMGSKFPALMAHTHFAAPLSAVFAVISDYDHFRDFIPSVVDSRILRRQGRCTWVYQRLHFSIFTVQRAYVLRIIDDLGRLADGVIHVSWRLDDEASAKQVRDHAVRPRRFNGSWHLVSRPGSGTTEATYTVDVDPGGRIPAWLMGSKGDRHILRVMRAVRARLRAKQGPASDPSDGLNSANWM